MLVKIVTVYLISGKREEIACFEYGPSIIEGIQVYAFKVARDKVYTVPVEKINLDIEFTIKYKWSFPPREGPFQLPYDHRKI